MDGIIAYCYRLLYIISTHTFKLYTIMYMHICIVHIYLYQYARINDIVSLRVYQYIIVFLRVID